VLPEDARRADAGPAQPHEALYQRRRVMKASSDAYAASGPRADSGLVAGGEVVRPVGASDDSVGQCFHELVADDENVRFPRPA
jgi:hypothetical protein